MTDSKITESHINKIGHPNKEISARNLLGLISKLECGASFDQELPRTGELLSHLTDWLKRHDATHRKQVLHLILRLVQSKAGGEILRTIGPGVFIRDLENIKDALDPNLESVLNQIIHTARRTQDEPNLRVPALNMPISPESEKYEKSTRNRSTDPTHLPHKLHSFVEVDNELLFDLNHQGVKIFLMPWCHLNESDLRKLKSNEDCLSASEFEERAIYFFHNILSKDFPPEVFLNRPAILMNIIKMINNPTLCLRSMEALLSYCSLLHVRIQEMFDPSSRISKRNISPSKVDGQICSGSLNLEQSQSTLNNIVMIRNSITTLKQLPLPFFCLDTIYQLIDYIGRSVIAPMQNINISICLRELHCSLSIIYKLFNIFKRVVSNTMWNVERPNSFIQEIIQKLIVIFSSSGKILNKLRISCSANGIKDKSIRVIHLRFLVFNITTTQWCNSYELIPSNFMSSLCDSIYDASFLFSFPIVHKMLIKILNPYILRNGTMEDQEKLKSFLNLQNICLSMKSSIKILQQHISLMKNTDIIYMIKNSLPALEYHKSIKIISIAVEVFSSKLQNWILNDDHWNHVTLITLELLAHNCLWVRTEFYSQIYLLVSNILSGTIRTRSENDEMSLKFLFEPSILIEICSHGIESNSSQIQKYAKGIIQHLLRGKLLISEETWKILLQALLSALPLLHVQTSPNDEFGKSILKTLEPTIGEYLLIPRIELIKGNIRLLYSKSFTAQVEGSNNLISLLYMDDETAHMLPKQESVVPDKLSSVMKNIKEKNFNVNKISDPNFYEESALLQIMNILKDNMPKVSQTNYLDSMQPNPGIVDPSVCRSALAQLAAILQQRNLHQAFLKNGGQDLILHYMRSSLLIDEFITFPESIMSCVAMLNSICYVNADVRRWASEQQKILLYLIRATLLFPTEENFIMATSQLLCQLVFCHFIMNTINFNHADDGNCLLSMHFAVVNNINLPFKCIAHSKVSPHRNSNTEEVLLRHELTRNYLCMNWCVKWYGGFDKIVKWPYIPTDEEEFSSSLKINDADLLLMKTTCPMQGCILALYEIQNATSHKSVHKSLNILEGYIFLANESNYDMDNLINLPWSNTLKRFLITSPASANDAVLLFNFIRLIENLLQAFRNNAKCIQIFSWVINPIVDCSNGVVSVLKDDHDSLNGDLTSIKLKEKMCQLISYCCALTNLPFYEQIAESEVDWSLIVNHLIDSLAQIHINNISTLASADQIMKCLVHLTSFSCERLKDEDMRENLLTLTKILINICNSLYNTKHVEYKGYSLLLNAFIILCHILNVILSDRNSVEYYKNVLAGNEKKTVVSLCIDHYNSQHVWLRSASFKLLSGLLSTQSLVSHLESYSDNIVLMIMKASIDTVCDFEAASVVREQAAIVVRNLLKTIIKNCDPEKDIRFLFDTIFFQNLIVILTKICLNEVNHISMGENICLTYLSKKEQCEVAFLKTGRSEIPMKLENSMPPKCSVKLLTIIADIVYNLLKVYEDIIEELGRSELFKIFFRCILLNIPNIEIKFNMCVSVCRLLHEAANESEEIHAALIDTRNCMNGLLGLFAIDEELNKEQVQSYIEMKKWAFTFIGTLLKTSHGFKCIWDLLLEGGINQFFYSLLTGISDKLYQEIIPSVLLCFSNFLNSCTWYNADKYKTKLEKFFDTEINIKVYNSSNDITKEDESEYTGKLATENTHYESDKNCHRITFGEEFCFHLLTLYKHNNKNTVDKRVKATNFDAIASGLCNLLGISHKAKILATESGFIEELLENLDETNYFLIMSSEQANLIKINEKSPILHYLNWTILLLGNIISNCDKAKNMSIECNLPSYINKLWPWIVSNGMLRFHTIEMLCSYTNSSIKASQNMCISTGTRSLLNEVIDLVKKEMNLVSRKHSLATLSGCLQILENVAPHVHCRTIIIKSDLFLCLNKLHPAITKRQAQWRRVEVIWEEFLNTITRYPEGQIKVAEHIGNVCALIHQADGLMFDVLRNCAFNQFNRPRFLGSAEIITLFSKTLTTSGPIVHKMAVAAALWALCSNSQKSKLSIKCAGLTGKLMDCLEALKCNSEEYEKEIQIMTYILKVVTTP